MSLTYNKQLVPTAYRRELSFKGLFFCSYCCKELPTEMISNHSDYSCKPCYLNTRKAYRERRKEHIREVERKRYHHPERHEKRLRYQRQYRKQKLVTSSKSENHQTLLDPISR